MRNTAYLLDPVMDICLLAAAQLSLSRLNLRRLLAGYAVLAGCTLLFLCFHCSPLLHIPAILLAAAAATGARRPGRILEAAFCTGCTAAAGAGFASLAGSRVWFAPPGALIAAVVLRRSRHINHRWNIEIEAHMNGNTISFPALIDTGNRLHEPLSGLPVTIVEAGLIPGVQDHLARLSSAETCSLPYGVLGGTGEIICFRPDSMQIVLPGRGRVRAPACWIGVFPGRIPGSTRALAPPEFADAVQNPVYISKYRKQSHKEVRSSWHFRALGNLSTGWWYKFAGVRCAISAAATCFRRR